LQDTDRVVWNAIISGLAMNGHVKTTVGLFGQIEKIGIQPHGNIFIGFLYGSTHAGLVDEGRQYFDAMNCVFSLTPTIERYGCMVALLGRLIDEAHKLLKGMPMEANAIVWGALLNGCRLHQDNMLADHVLTKLIQLGPWYSGNYVLFSNIYSASHGWDDAAKI
jgi:pentatricopeptide repeat protein